MREKGSKQKQKELGQAFFLSINFFRKAYLYMLQSYKVQFVSSVSYGLKNFVLFRRYFPLPAKYKQDLEQKFFENVLCEN